MNSLLICALTLILTLLTSSMIMFRAESLMTPAQMNRKDRALDRLSRDWRRFCIVFHRRRWRRLPHAGFKVWSSYARWKRVHMIGWVDLVAVRFAGLALLAACSVGIWDVLLALIEWWQVARGG